MCYIYVYLIMENGKLNEEKLEKMIGGQNYGFIEGIILFGKECLILMNEVQKYMCEKIWLGIFVFMLIEFLYGFVYDGFIIFL